MTATDIRVVDRGTHLLAAEVSSFARFKTGRQGHPYGLRIDSALGQFDVGLNLYRADCEPDYTPQSLQFRAESPDRSRTIRLYPFERDHVAINRLRYRLIVAERSDQSFLPPRRARDRVQCFVRGDRLDDDDQVTQRHFGMTDGARYVVKELLAAVSAEITNEEWRLVEELVIAGARNRFYDVAERFEADAAALRERGDQLVASFW